MTKAKSKTSNTKVVKTKKAKVTPPKVSNQKRKVMKEKLNTSLNDLFAELGDVQVKLDKAKTKKSTKKAPTKKKVDKKPVKKVPKTPTKLESPSLNADKVTDEDFISVDITCPTGCDCFTYTSPVPTIETSFLEKVMEKVIGFFKKLFNIYY